jgi:hypothetical protein
MSTPADSSSTLCVAAVTRAEDLEAHVLKTEFAPLFTDADRDQARDRLEAYGWRPLP